VRAALFALPTLAAVAVARDASADYYGPKSGWYLPVGVDVGYALSSGAPGVLLGGEVSVVYIDMRGLEGGPSGPVWIGAFASGGYITGQNAGRFSFGPEVGYAIFGLDGGFVDIVADGRDTTGVTLRPMLTLSFITVYGRWDHTFDRGGVDTGQVGLMLKFPVAITGKL
jgi:hypothetical protein